MADRTDRIAMTAFCLLFPAALARLIGPGAAAVMCGLMLIAGLLAEVLKRGRGRSRRSPHARGPDPSGDLISPVSRSAERSAR